MFGLLFEYLELGFPGIRCGIERQQISQQTFQRQVLLERFEQDVFGALGLDRRIEHFFFGGQMLGQVVADARQRRRARLWFAALRLLFSSATRACGVDRSEVLSHPWGRSLRCQSAVCTTARRLLSLTLTRMTHASEVI